MATEAEEKELEQVMQLMLNLKMDSPPDGDDVLPAADATPSCGDHAQWAEHLFDLMNGAADEGAAKACAANLLEAFEGSAVADSRTQRGVAVEQNALLKKAVLALHRLYTEEKGKKQVLQSLAARSHDQVVKLENDKYSLTMQLRQAQTAQLSSMAGHSNRTFF